MISDSTVDWEIFVLNIFRASIFRGVKFLLSGPSTKILSLGSYHRNEYGRALWLVASAFIVKSGRQLLQKYS